MWKHAVHRLLGPATAAFLMSRAWRRGEMPYPDDLPLSHGPGPDPDRILLIGGTLVRGIGVRSYELGLPGNLARKLAAYTGHGADVEAHGIPMLTVARAIEELRGERLKRFDAIVLMLGNSEVLTLRPKSLWRKDLTELHEALIELAPNGPPVIVTSIPPFAAAFDVPQFVRRRVARTIARLNVQLRRGVEATQTTALPVTLIDFDNAGPAPRVGSHAADAYEMWAEAIVRPLALAISRADPELHNHDVPVDEAERQQALDAMGVVGSDPGAIVDRIVEMARDMLGVPAASLTLIDNDRQWMMAASGIPADDIPRSEAICNTTIRTPGVFVVEDASEDPAFQNASWVAGAEHIRSYAGYPVEAPGGQRVGALCVMDRSPRHFTPDDVATLRGLALRAQQELWMAVAG